MNPNKIHLYQEGAVYPNKLTPEQDEHLDADTKALIEAGIIQANLMPTPGGVELLTGLLWKEKRKELVKIAKEQLKEHKKNKTKSEEF